MTGKVLYRLTTPSGDDLSYYIDMNDMPSVDDFTEEAEGRIALEILKSLKLNKIISYAIYSEDVTENRIEIIK